MGAAREFHRMNTVQISWSYREGQRGVCYSIVYCSPSRGSYTISERVLLLILLLLVVSSMYCIAVWYVNSAPPEHTSHTSRTSMYKYPLSPQSHEPLTPHQGDHGLAGEEGAIPPQAPSWWNPGGLRERDGRTVVLPLKRR